MYENGDTSWAFNEAQTPAAEWIYWLYAAALTPNFRSFDAIQNQTHVLPSSAS